MNNIYKVIWSKAKNCYVVASEIARSHTKSASGSEKIGGGTRRKLLASLMALSLLCGGLGVASASLEVVDQSGTAGTVTIYTKDEVDNALLAKGAATDVAANKTDIETLKTAVGNAGSGLTKDVADQKADIATNRANINNLDGKLANLTTTVSGKADEAAVTTALGDKANTDLSNLTADGVNKIKNTMSADMELKADKTYVDNALNDKAATATVTALDGRVGNLETKVGDASSGLVKDVADLKAQGNTLNTELGNKANQSDLVAATTRITTNEGNITALQKKTAKLSDDGNELTGMTTVSGTTVSGTNVEANALKVTGEISNGAGVTTTLTDINDSMTQTATNKGDIAALQTKTGEQQTAINGLNEKTTQISYDPAKGTTVNDVDFKDAEVNVNGKGLTGVSTLHTTGAATIGGALKADSLIVENASNLKGDVTMDKTLKVTGDTTLKGTKVDGKLTVTDDADLKNTKVDGTLTTTGKATFQEAVEMDKGLTVTSGDTTLKGTKVDGKLTVTDDADLKNTKVDGTLTTTGKATFQEAVEMDKGLTVTNGDTTLKGTKVDGKLTVTDDAELKNTEVKGTLGVTGATTLSGELTAKENAIFEKDVTVKGTTTLKNTTVDGDLKVTGTITTDKMIFGDKATNNYTEIDHGKVTSKNLVVDAAGKTISSSSTFNAEENKVGFVNSATGDQSFHKQTSDVIMDNVKDGKNSNNRTQTKTETKDIITDKDGNSSTTSQTASENKTYLKDKDGKNTNSTVDTAKGYDKTIKGENGETSTKQDELNITNTAQNGTITNDAQNIVNNATGDMTNIVGGKLTTTVTGATEENYNGGLTTKVTGEEKHTVTGKQTNTVEGGQENIISGGQTNTITGGQINNITGDQTTTITGNKTETVEGKLIENFQGGQETNVTGDQTTNVSGTQTTTATDINRNASSGMIDTIDNDYGTNTETKVAGETKTEVSIKGTGEKGEYIRGATQSRDYLIKGTLKNSETKTAEATSSEVTDGTNKASTIQDAKNLAGFVTNGTETGISGIHAKDGSVSIDSLVTGGGMSSVINQKKDSIQSAVGDGTNSTVILQDKDNVTIASSKGMVAIGGKDIVNNAQDTITNTAGTKITDTAGDSTVTTENGKGTTFAKDGSAAYSKEAGAPTDTNIAGNHITTGRVDANELGVSDKDDQGNTADFSVKAGEGIKGSATDKDGNKTSTKVTATENSFQVQDKDGKIKNHQVNTKDSSENTITNGDKTNTVTSTADGTIFSNSEAAAPVTGASGAGTAVNTTIKGNTITTGKVTMDYAEVMKDLGVHGNANITGKTTTGSLEVTGTSTLTGDVTMGSNATVKGNFNVEGNTNLKNTNVDGTLDVTQKATFGDSVSIAKDLSVGGDVTAKSYKVGDKTYISAAGINANNQKITNVADGSISEGSKDAVNGGQLYGVKNDLEGKVNKVGANAAAMANLHPMEFDPDSKWNIAAAMGNYGSETATAIGAFYRPNEDVMVNFSTAFGTGENMVGGGVSVRLGKGGNKLSREESNALKAQVNDLTARMDALLSVLNPNMSKDFPDVPENHWAYEAVSRLAGNDIVQGYPDGEFHGERTMTRYEMAEIIYNALSRGAEAERELVEEFKPELQAMAASEKATAERAEG